MPRSAPVSSFAATFANVAFGGAAVQQIEGGQIMRKSVFRPIVIGVVAATLVFPAWAARGGGGSGHGATVSAAAHSAHMSGSPVGPSVRSVARSNSQGPSHASANAISHVQNSPGKANSNSVLGNGDTSTSTQMASGRGQGKAAKTAKSGKAKGKKSNH
jgi:hypothetical protein